MQNNMKDVTGQPTCNLIPLSNSDKRVLVDIEDYAYLSQFTWYTDRKGYALRTLPRNGGNGRHMRMHRELLNAEKGQIVDHINRNKLDNRKENLRFATPSQSCMNQNLRKDNQYGYRGVSYRKETGKWRAWINVNKNRVNLGQYTTPEEAALAYNEAALRYHQEYAVLNKLPEGIEEVHKWHKNEYTRFIGKDWMSY